MLKSINHPKCSLERSLQACAERGIKLTPLWRIGLEIIMAENAPIAAYGLIAELKLRLGKHVNPTTAYRVLEYFQENGLVARIESRNAYLALANLEDPIGRAFFLCDHCGSVQEVAVVDDALGGIAEEIGFRIGRRIVEFEGTCANCQDDVA